jgi:hypothetical protein
MFGRGVNWPALRPLLMRVQVPCRQHIHADYHRFTLHSHLSLQLQVPIQ